MSETEHQIGFGQLGLGALLKDYRLAVDAYQREYAWESKEVTTLFRDLSREIFEGSSSYFLGTIVTIPKENKFLEVVDGQQRLATTAILLTCIKDYLRGIESERGLALSIEEDFLSVFDRPTRSRVPRLQLNLDDNEYFRSRLAADVTVVPTKPSHFLIDTAFTESNVHVRSIVSGHDLKDHGTVLNRWVDFLESKASIILLRVPNASNAYRMFETLNDRGKRVSQSDLVKSYLYGQAGKRRPEVQQKWSHMRGSLETIEDDDGTIEFLRHALTVLRGFTRKTEVYEAVRNHTRGEQPAVSFAGQLENLASAFVAIHIPDHSRWNGVADSARRALEVLNLLDLKIIQPVLLAVAHQFTGKEIEKALRLCVAVSVRLMIGNRTRTGSVEEGLADAGHKIFKGEISDCQMLKQSLASISLTEGQFRTAFQSATVTKGTLARYYLRSLEMKAKGEPEPWHIPNDDKGIINLEHVLPDKTEGKWPQFSDDEVRSHRNRIGNLVLLRVRDNSHLKSEKFDLKRAVYAKSPYELTRQVSLYDDWTTQKIEDRQSVLADLALKTWPL